MNDTEDFLFIAACFGSDRGKANKYRVQSLLRGAHALGSRRSDGDQRYERPHDSQVTQRSPVCVRTGQWYSRRLRRRPAPPARETPA